MTGAVAALAGMGGGIGFLNAADKAASVILSEGARRSSASSAGAVRSVVARRSGKFYFEVQNLGASAGGSDCGLLTAAMSLVDSISTSGGISVNASGILKIAGSAQLADIGALDPGNGTACFAIDFAAKLVWVRKDGGAWHSGDPAAGTGGSSFSTLTAALHAATSAQTGTPPDWRVNLLRRHFTQTPPSGFASWG